MDKAALTAEAERLLKRWAVAKSTLNECEAFFNQHGKELGPIEAYGCWAGPRRSFSEAYNPGILKEVLLDLGLAADCPLLDLLFGVDDPDAPPPVLSDSLLKRIAENKPWREKVKNKLNSKDEDGNLVYEDGGMELSYGGWNYGPIKEAPSPDKYEVPA